MDTYLAFKSLHLLGVVVFLGNIIVTGWWKMMADRTRNPAIVAFAQHQVTLTDWVFTAGGAALVLIGGVGNAWLHGMDFLAIHWMAWGFWLFNLSGLLWVTILIPVQIAQARMARQFAGGGEIPERYWLLGRIWMSVGTLATLIPMFNLYWMVFKPTE